MNNDTLSETNSVFVASPNFTKQNKYAGQSTCSDGMFLMTCSGDQRDHTHRLSSRGRFLKASACILLKRLFSERNLKQRINVKLRCLRFTQQIPISNANDTVVHKTKLVGVWCKKLVSVTFANNRPLISFVKKTFPMR